MKYKPAIAAEKSGSDGLSLTGGTLVGLLRAVHEKGADFRMTARGWSMYPSIRDGDVITISPFRNRPPHIGEVVAFTRPDAEKLVVHRVMKKVQGAYLIKGDNTFDPDGTIPEACLLGVVTRVERGTKRIFWPDRFRHRTLARLYFTIVPPLSRWLMPIRAGLSGLGARVIHSRPYRRFMKVIYGRLLNKLEIEVEPSPSIHSKQKFGRGGYIAEGQTTGIAAAQQHLFIVARAKRRQIGYMELFQSPEECPFSGWWIVDYGIDLPYKGSGLEECMLTKAVKVLADRGVASIMINLPEHSECIGSWCWDAGLRQLPAGNCGRIGRLKRVVMGKSTGCTSGKY
ncbi:S26 family signal peptidase [Methanocella sp. MCL-LM]|uniref:S26 family signal peptidase n=1 Tax=Methanocella sp. MCL-LM TaxID=3412035 RepID=UPI003C77A8ED